MLTKSWECKSPTTPPPPSAGDNILTFSESLIWGAPKGLRKKKFFCSYVPCVSISHYSCEGKKCGNDFEKR